MLVAVPLVDVAALQFLLGRRAQGDPLDLELQLRPRQRMIEIQTHRVIRHILNAGITRVAFFVGVIVFFLFKNQPALRRVWCVPRGRIELPTKGL